MKWQLLNHVFSHPICSHSLNWKDILRPVLNTIRSLCRERLIQRRVHLLASAEDRKKKSLIVNYLIYSIVDTNNDFEMTLT